ncbi:MAG TPA: transporter substrate-binding domain-containing protein [Gammaproteobacteria bacterium]|nr:transporter substrate-binding domain-containing protein [Gammaproteobacteria bacterium]
MKKFITMVFGIIFLCGCQKETADNTWVVATNATYAPYVSIKDGKIVGFDMDVAKIIAEKLHKKIEIKDMGFDSLILALQQNKVDMIIGGISITPSREKEIFLIPYQGKPVTHFTLVLWEKPNRSIEKFEDLVGLHIAVQTGTIQQTFLERYPSIKIDSLEGNTETLMNVQYKKSFAALVEPVIAQEMQLKFPHLTLIDLPLPEEFWALGNGIGVAKNNPEKRDRVAQLIEDMQKEGILAQLEQKWLKVQTHD